MGVIFEIVEVTAIQYNNHNGFNDKVLAYVVRPENVDFGSNIQATKDLLKQTNYKYLIFQNEYGRVIGVILNPYY